MRFGESWLNAAERKFGRIAIPDLIRWIVIFQTLVWALVLMRDAGSSVPNPMIEGLSFSWEKIQSGQIWRLFSFIFLPRSMGFIFVLFSLMFMWFISNTLEQEWGSFRVNLYVSATIVGLIIAGILLSFAFGDIGPISMKMSFLVLESTFLTFATLFPHQTINLFGIIPIKAMWLGFAGAALMVADIIRIPAIMLPLTLLGMLPYFIVFIPEFVRRFKQSGEAAVRRAKFQAAAATNEDGAFHTCEQCGKTDISDPEAHFRITADDKELCEDCLEKG